MTPVDIEEINERIGKTLCGKYTLEGLLGVGGMASVFRARHRNGHKVAVKLLHTELSVSADIRSRFLREGYAANKVDHPGVVRVTDDDVGEDGAAFLVMELLEGQPLNTHIEEQGGTLSAAEIVPLMCQLLEVLDAAHKQEIVHRDIKPENLFLEAKTGKLKVLDFGIARMAGGQHATKTGGLMGTPTYMAPEQARGETKLVDGRSDLWAVGAIMFRCLVGRPVFEGPTPEIRMILAATQKPERLETLAAEAGPELCAIVDRALLPSKKERWSSAREMLDALQALPPERLSKVRMPPPVTTERTSFHPTEELLPTSIREALTPSGIGNLGDPTRKAPKASPPTHSLVGMAQGSVAHPAPRLDRRVLVGVGVVGAALIALAITSRAPSSPGPASAGASSTPKIADTPSSPSSVPSPVAVAAATASPAAASADVSRGSAAAAKALPEAGVSKAAPPGPPAARPSASSAPKPNCNPNFTLDAQGEKIFKPECFR